VAIDGYVKQILNSPVFIFDEIMTKLLANNMQSAKIELSRQSMELDYTLFQAIKSILSDLKNEEGILSRFLYKTFGFELHKNKRREQLICLGIQLKTQYIKIEREIFRINRQIDRFSLSIADLKRLKKGFATKNIYLQDAQTLNKSKFYMNELEIHLHELKEMQLLLQNKYKRLLDKKRNYLRLLKKIPRYYELQEESYELLLGKSP